MSPTIKTRAAIFLLAALPLVAVGCKKADKAPETEVIVQAQKPTQGTIAEHIVTDAILSPLAQAAIAPKISAPVKHFYVQRGSRVRAGQLLVSLENQDLQAAALDNKGALTAAEATYDTQTRAQVPEDTQKAQLDLAQATANLNLNQSIVNGRKQLFAQGAIPGRDLDTAQAALVQAQAAYDTAKKHLQSVQNVSRAAALKSASGTLTSAKGKYLGAQAQVNYSEIRSPINGVVTDRSLFSGETAPAGTALITVMDTSSLIAKVHLAQPLAQSLSLNADATVSVPGLTDDVPAKVSLISPALDPGSTTVEVWVRINNPKGSFKVGTPVHVAVTGRVATNAVIIPSTAIITATEGTKSVMVIGADNLAHRKAVTTGIEDAGQTQLLTGVSLDDMIITGGAFGLEDKTKVKIGAAAADDDAKPGAADDAKPGADDAKPAADDAKPATGDKAKPAADDAKPAAGKTSKPSSAKPTTPAGKGGEK